MNQKYLWVAIIAFIVVFTQLYAKEVQVPMHGEVMRVNDDQYVFVCYGPGTNCIAVITVPDEDSDQTTRLPEYPRALYCPAVSFLDVDVVDEDGQHHTYSTTDKCNASYHIEFSYTWEDGVTTSYTVENYYPQN